MRMLGEMFAQLLSGIDSQTMKELGNPYNGINYLAPWMVKEIQSYLVAHDYGMEDLLAMRQSPAKWGGQYCYDWLWILHRYLNQYAKS